MRIKEPACRKTAGFFADATVRSPVPSSQWSWPQTFRCAASFFMIAMYRSVWFAIIFQLRVRLVRMVASAPLCESSMRR